MCLALFALKTANAHTWPTYREHAYPIIHAYTDKQVGALGRAYASVQDQKGILFFAHDEGVLLFNGVEWSTIPIDGGKAARSLAVDSTGVVYVGTDNEFGALRPDATGQLRYQSISDSLNDLNERIGPVNNAFALADGVYFIALNKLFRYQNDTVEIVEADIRIISDQAFVVDGDLVLNIAGKGLCRLVDGNWEPLIAGGILVNESISGVVRLQEEDSYLIGLKFQGLVSVKKHKAYRFLTPMDNYLRNNVISTLTALPYGHIGIGTFRGGLAVINQEGKPIWIENKESGLPDNAVSSITFDQQKGVWTTTDNGIARLELYGPISTFGEASDLRGNVLLMTRFQGLLYVVTRQGIYFLNEFDTTRLDEPYFRFHDNFGEVQGFFTEFKDLLTIDQSLLVATADGIYELVDMEPRKVVPDNTNALYFNAWSSDIAYAATTKGLRILMRQNNMWTSSYSGFGLPFAIDAMLQQGTTLWLSSNTNGILKVDLHKSGTEVNDLEYFGFDGFEDNSPITLHQLDGKLLFSSQKGLYLFNPDKNAFYRDTALFVPSFYATPKQIKSIMSTGAGQWVIITDQGTSASSMTEDGKYAWEPGGMGAYADRSFATSFLDDNGLVWLGGSKGLLRIDPVIGMATTHPISMHITAVELNGQDAIYGLYDTMPKNLTLNYGVNRLKFSFAANNFAQPEANRFQYKLDGFDDEWSDWTTQATKEYTNLSEGKYTFYVRTKNMKGEYANAEPFTFTILSPWYRTWWSYLLEALALAGVVYFVIFLRSKKLKKEKETLEAEVQERTKELKQSQNRLVEQQKLASLGQLTAGIAHEIKNPLNFVNNFAELSEELVTELDEELDKLGDKIPPDDKDYISEILTDLKHNVQKINEHGKRADNIMRGMLMHSRAKSDEKELVVLNEMLDENIKLAYHGFRSKNAGTQVQIEKNFDDKINQINIIKQDVARVVLNIVNNAIYAAIKRRDEEPEGFVPKVIISSQLLSNGMVEIKIKDNGIGISAENIKKIFNPFFTTKPTGEGTGLGLSISYDIIVKSHGGQLRVESEVRNFTQFIIQLPYK